MSWQLHDAATPTRTLIMVSRFGHCLNDLLFRHRIGALHDRDPGRGLQPPRTSSRWPPPTASRSTTSRSRRTPRRRPRRGCWSWSTSTDIDLVVLARYMQVLSDDLCTGSTGRAINIHHSFLPSFKGAKPYHQAHARGVKLIGATAHYVTADLDEGPIIEQDVARVDHSLTPSELVAAGRDVEAQVLARAVRWHAERRVLLDGNRTVVFR